MACENVGARWIEVRRGKAMEEQVGTVRELLAKDRTPWIGKAICLLGDWAASFKKESTSPAPSPRARATQLET
jgi:hypothetical protein